MFKNIKDVQQLLVIKPKRLLHSNRATHLQCDSLLFRGRFFKAEIRNSEDALARGEIGDEASSRLLTFPSRGL